MSGEEINLKPFTDRELKILSKIDSLRSLILRCDDDDLSEEVLIGLEKLCKFVYVSRCHIQYESQMGIKTE